MPHRHGCVIGVSRVVVAAIQLFFEHGLRLHPTAVASECSRIAILRGSGKRWFRRRTSRPIVSNRTCPPATSRPAAPPGDASEGFDAPPTTLGRRKGLYQIVIAPASNPHDPLPCRAREGPGRGSDCDWIAALQQIQPVAARQSQIENAACTPSPRALRGLVARLRRIDDEAGAAQRSCRFRDRALIFYDRTRIARSHGIVPKTISWNSRIRPAGPLNFSERVRAGARGLVLALQRALESILMMFIRIAENDEPPCPRIARLTAIT